MKKYINFLMLALSITCNLQASLRIEYWNNNVKKPKSTIQKNIPLKEKCALTLAMIKEHKTVNLEKSIPLLMEVYTKEIHTLPEPTLTAQDIQERAQEKALLNYMTKPVTAGPLYEVFKNTVNNDPILQKRNPSLREMHGYIPVIIGYFIKLPPAFSTSSIIVTDKKIDTFDDGTKLHMMTHELQHQRNGLNHDRTTIAYANYKCHLADLQKTPYVRAILKSKIKNSQGENLQSILDKLDKDGTPLNKEIIRYEEFRADTRSLENIQCPYCVQEASMYSPRENGIGYRPDGYINQWQFQPRIEKLKRQGTICQHHHENGEKIDTSICDGSTLEKRMIILDKKNIEDCMNNQKIL